MTWLEYIFFFFLIPTTVPTTPTLTELSNELHSVVNWHSLGVKLGVEDHELTTIEKNFRGDNERCKHEMLSRWLRNAKQCTWKAVADALRRIEERAVASEIRKKHYGSPPTPTPGTCLCYVVHLI